MEKSKRTEVMFRGPIHYVSSSAVSRFRSAAGISPAPQVFAGKEHRASLLFADVREVLRAHTRNRQWRGAGVAEQGCLLSSYTGKTGVGGSNPPLSASHFGVSLQ